MTPKRYDRKYHNENGTFSEVIGGALGSLEGPWGATAGPMEMHAIYGIIKIRGKYM